MSIKHMDIKEFREFGYLQEVNRKFLHPLGLALETTIEEDGAEHLSGVWDYRDDPEGIIIDKIDQDKVQRVADQATVRFPERVKRLHFWVQMKDYDDGSDESS